MSSALIWFVGLPVVIVLAITGIVLLATSDRNHIKSTTDLNRIG
jgi:hypothetical protein